MTRRLFNPFLLLMARLTDPELARAVQFLKIENAMLRSRLPKRIDLTPRERDRLFELGESLGAAVRELISIVTYRILLRWQGGQARRDQDDSAQRPFDRGLLVGRNGG